MHKSKEAREYDDIRNKFLESLDYKVLRFWNSEVDKDINSVIKRIQNYLQNLTPSDLTAILGYGDSPLLN